MPHEVVLLPGDGIGPEVTAAARRVVEATGVAVDWLVYDVGVTAVQKGHEPLPVGVLESVRSTGVALKGPVSTPRGAGGFPSVNLALRRELGLHAQVRPCRLRPGVPSHLRSVDLLVVRDTTEDLYAGIEVGRDEPLAADLRDLLARHGRSLPERAGVAVKFVTEAAVDRVVRLAFDLARTRPARSVTAVHKATVMPTTDGLFLDTARGVASDYPDIEFRDESIDAMCARLVRDASAYDVLVMGYQYGDIVSDVAGALVGGIGLIPGVNLGPGVAVFEAAHGTAPHRAEQDVANPVAMVLCAAMLLRHLGEVGAADGVEQAVDAVLAAGKVRTYDLVGTAPAVGTAAMTEAVVAALP